jgi:hypothetical protein
MSTGRLVALVLLVFVVLTALNFLVFDNHVHAIASQATVLNPKNAGLYPSEITERGLRESIREGQVYRLREVAIVALTIIAMGIIALARRRRAGNVPPREFESLSPP